MEVQSFILRKPIVFKGFRGVSSFSNCGVKLFFFFFFFGGGGGGGGVKMLISIDTCRTYDIPGGSGPYPTSGTANALIF